MSATETLEQVLRVWRGMFECPDSECAEDGQLHPHHASLLAPMMREALLLAVDARERGDFGTMNEALDWGVAYSGKVAEHTRREMGDDFVREAWMKAAEGLREDLEEAPAEAIYVTGGALSEAELEALVEDGGGS